MAQKYVWRYTLRLFSHLLVRARTRLFPTFFLLLIASAGAMLYDKWLDQCLDQWLEQWFGQWVDQWWHQWWDQCCWTSGGSQWWDQWMDQWWLMRPVVAISGASQSWGQWLEQWW